MTSPEEYAVIAQGADAFMLSTYGDDQVVNLRGTAMTLRQAHDFEEGFRGLEALAADDQLRRAGIWAQLLLEAGVLREDHVDLPPYAGDYLKG